MLIIRLVPINNSIFKFKGYVVHNSDILDVRYVYPNTTVETIIYHTLIIIESKGIRL